MIMYQIKYDDSLGVVHTYMNTGFESPGAAEAEIVRLERDKAGHEARGLVTRFTQRYNYRVVPVKINVI